MRELSCVAVLNRENKLLICKRVKEPYKDLFDLPGGKADEDESALNAAYRELFEETGISRDDIELRPLIDLLYHRSDTAVRYFCGRLNKEVTLVEEINPLFWFDLDSKFGDASMFAGNGDLAVVVSELVKLGI